MQYRHKTMARHSAVSQMGDKGCADSVLCGARSHPHSVQDAFLEKEKRSNVSNPGKGEKRKISNVSNLGKGEKIQCIECSSPFIWFTHAMPPPSPCCNLSIVTWLERTPANPSLPIQHLLSTASGMPQSNWNVFTLLASRFWTGTHSIKPHSYRLLIIEGMRFNEESFKIQPRQDLLVDS